MEFKPNELANFALLVVKILDPINRFSPIEMVWKMQKKVVMIIK